MDKTDVDKVSWRGRKEGNQLRVQKKDGKKWASATDPFEIWGTNETGFSALPATQIRFDGIIDLTVFPRMAFWWSSTPEGNEAWYRYLDNNKGGVFRFYGSKTYGFSIRCVKDN
jgi:uncharacterized protein (TIGR02145 family)